MKLNIHILYDELKAFSPQIATSRDIDLTLRQVRYPEFPHGKLQQDCIYLMEDSEIEQHAQILRDVDMISIGSIDENSDVFSGLSVISLTQECHKTVIFNQIQDIFEKYDQWDYSLMRSIAANESLQSISDLAASVLSNPFALFDRALKKIIHAGSLPEDYKGTIWELVMEKGYTPAETFSLSPDELFSILRIHHKKPYIPKGAPYPQYSHLYFVK